MALRVSLWPALLLLPVMVATAAEAPVVETSAAEVPAAVAPVAQAPAEAATSALSASAATVVVTAPGKNPDPWEKFNRATYRFNDVADRYVLKPVAKGYRNVTPETVRTGVTNFFSNLRSPLVVMNDLLQGKVKQAGSDTLRFVVNSTVGVVGLIDVGARINLPLHDEDFGQTLGVWGVPSGPYLVLPFMGPSSVRDGAGFAVDAVANPRRRIIPDEADWILFGLDVVNSRASLLDLEDIIQGDRYLFIRDLYLQRRQYSIQDGQISDDPFLDDSFDDESSEAGPATEETPESPSEEAPAKPVTAPASPEQGSLDAAASPLQLIVTTDEFLSPAPLDGSGG